MRLVANSSVLRGLRAILQQTCAVSSNYVDDCTEPLGLAIVFTAHSLQVAVQRQNIALRAVCANEEETIAQYLFSWPTEYMAVGNLILGRPGVLPLAT